MTIAGDAQQKMDAYLNHLRGCLRGLGPEEIREIVEELRSHILDRASAGGELTAAGVDAALGSLGSPDQLAREYVTDVALAQAEVSRSPVRILRTLYGWARLSMAGFFALLVAILGYGTGIAFFLVAALKPFHSHNAGLWIWRNAGDTVYSVRLGFSDPPPAARELLGWRIIPIGLAVSCAAAVLTTHFATWCVRQHRQARALRHR